MECYSEQDLFAATDLSLNAELNSAYLLRNSIFFCLVSAVVEEVIVASQASMKE